MTLRYGLIGAGMMGCEHARNLRLLDGVTLAAVADPDAAMRDACVGVARAAGFAPAVYADHRALLDNADCDAFIIASPNDTHHEILADLLSAPSPKPALCEKPLCATAADCRDIIARADAAAAPVWVAMEYRYMPAVARALELARAGAVGAPRMLAVREHRFPFLKKVDDWNRFNRRTGGTLVEKCCHFWDLMRHALQSEPLRVYASAGVDVNHIDESYDGETPDIIDNAFVIVDFANGARGMLDLCMFAEGSYWQEVVSITGDAARVDACVPAPARFTRGEERAGEVVLSRRDGAVSTETAAVDADILRAGDHHGATYFQHVKFRDMLISGGAPEVNLTDGLQAVLVGEAAERSARLGEAVRVEAV